MTTIQRFTPQHSPSHPSSNASPTSSVSAEEERAEIHPPQEQEQEQIRPPKEFEIPNALRGWTAHQSHGQATVLFYVPRWVQAEALDVTIEEDYIVAGMRGHKPIVSARLAGRINSTTSAWQLERKSNGKRSRSRSRTRMRTRSSDQISSNSSSGKGWVKAGARPSRESGVATNTTSRPNSPVQSDTSSFEMLARSIDTLASRPSMPSSEGIGSPRSLSQSMTLSDDSNARNSTAGGARSMESSISIEHSQTPSSSSKGDTFEDPTRDAKLVTLHLDKIDGGIWPCIVEGPVPTREAMAHPSTQPLARLVSVQSQGSLNAAISEAIRQQQSRSRENSFDSSDGNEPMVNESTLTVDTISSDDSTTVLGSGQTAQMEEDLYNMDPISLTLMGMQHARRSSSMPFGGASTRDESQAFECYRRAWREAEIPTAIEHLVHYYLPLNPAKKSTILASYRQRLTAALGGSTALARLYVSYAHLYMQSYEFDRPLLALPLTGMSNNPFGAHSVMHEGIQGDNEGIGPLQYLLEARNLDPALVISEDDWQEAKKLDEERSAHHSWSGAASPSARSDDTGSQPSSGKSRKTKRRKAGSRRDKLGGHHHHHHSTDQGIVFLVVSRAALLSVAVAGCMAVAGWYRRAATGAGA
ncbi:uncharacterized protein FA14DRAFT_36640 [Meira miltonrushii]|uniref:CS domain-containing protein n=1 Tax=Meira miltonrushii TaxID=1280837 RepID=A0A316VBH8_9BASI|nr:uncharacterized protein FA14DRAFT_36640 [Meira miltonrushii]PWN35007.1 hypothetical protein FA14DRAFT_36640 [Meira miltonrushii]